MVRTKYVIGPAYFILSSEHFGYDEILCWINSLVCVIIFFLTEETLSLAVHHFDLFNALFMRTSIQMYMYFHRLSILNYDHADKITIIRR